MLLDHLPVLNPFLMTMPRTFLEDKSFFFFLLIAPQAL